MGATHFRGRIEDVIREHLEGLQAGGAAAEIAALSFATRRTAEPDLPACSIQCLDAEETSPHTRLYEVSVEINIESSFDDADNLASHAARVAWVEAVFESCKIPASNGVTIQDLKISQYAEGVEDRPGDLLTLTAWAYPW